MRRNLKKTDLCEAGAEAYLPQEIARKYSYESAASGWSGAGAHCDWNGDRPVSAGGEEYGVTRACLEELAKREGFEYFDYDKSNRLCGI